MKFVGQKKKRSIYTEDILFNEVSNEELLDFIPNKDATDLIKDNILYYISGFIVKSIYSKIDCDTCIRESRAFFI